MHIKVVFRFIFLATVLSVVLSACQRHSQKITLDQPALQQVVHPQLADADSGFNLSFAPPSVLMKGLEDRRAVSYVEADLVKAGQEFDPLLPSHRATAGTGVTFDPAWSDTAAAADQVAFCMYEFLIPDYDRNPQVRVTWSTPPPTVTDAWVGLGNWGPDTWDWYKCNPVGKINLPSMDPYIAFGGGLLLCVAVIGSDSCTLAEVRIGTQLPQPVLSPMARHAFPPLNLNFNASGSVDPDGTIMSYEWDLDGDGTFETNTGLTTEASYEYTVPGTYHPAVRITDDDGVSAIAVSEIGVATEFSHTWGSAGSDSTGDVVADSAGNIYQVGKTYLVGDASSAQIVKYNAVGQPVWSVVFDGSEYESYSGIVIGLDGVFYVCGSTSSFGSGDHDGLLQCWSQDGELIWSKVWGGGQEDMFNGLTMSSGDIYVVGHTYSFGNYIDAVVTRFNANGDLVWERTFGGADHESANAIARSKTFLGDPELHIVGVTQNETIMDFDVMYYTISEGCVYHHRKTFGDDGLQLGSAVVVPSIFGGQTIIIGHTYTGIASSVLIVPTSGDWAKTWGGVTHDECYDIVRLLNGNYLIAGSTEKYVPASKDAVLIEITGDGAGIDLAFRDYQGSRDAATALCYYTDGIVIAGDAPDNNSEWVDQTLFLGYHGGTWTNVGWGLIDPDATLMDANGAVLPVTGAVLNTGGGEGDFLLELRKQ